MQSNDRKQALHRMNPTGRFSDRAADYARFRPGYPSGMVDEILSGLGEPGLLVAADVGAGTGIFSRLLADRGLRVIAIEPNASMRAAAEPHGRIEWRDATAESTLLEDGSVDLVVSAQAFHWFEPTRAIAEFARILRPGGRLALVWNQRDGGDALTAGYTGAIRSVGGEHPAEAGPPPTQAIESSGRFGPVRASTWPNSQRLDRGGLLGRALSASYTPKDAASVARLKDTLARLWAEHRDADGFVSLRYTTVAFVAETPA